MNVREKGGRGICKEGKEKKIVNKRRINWEFLGVKVEIKRVCLRAYALCSKSY